MKLIFLRLLPLAALFSCVTPAFAGRVSEPPATFYGRVIHRVGDRDFLVTEGKLRWTLASTQPGGKQYELAADLKPLGGGEYSYLLRVPHQLLAYDLTVAGKAVPLTAAGTRFRHLKVTVNDQPAMLVAPAVDSFTADQSARAATYHIDLDVSGLSPDSDGDGIPDWWEDKHGTDKWNPLDGPAVSATPQPAAADLPDESLTSFGLWRTRYFADDQRDLNLFANEDADGDHVVHVLEYAFGLNPLEDEEARPWLPAMRLKEGKATLEFGSRRKATDLEYVIEISEDLISWRKAQAEEIAMTIASEDSVFDRVAVRPEYSEDQAHSYLRVRVNRKP